ncbi:MAG: sugar phosphate nucleotidyltransferase [Oscillospiraceae bacterium]|nr:sugar phosphate nucleotidyltransferase [Oscillospiraceae bacterium]
MKKAIIMAGGEGTRLRPLTCSLPKPLAKLCGRPVVHYILDLLDKHGFEEAIFTLGYKAGQIEDLFETGRYKNLTLRFSHEEFPLGTAGCVKQAIFNSNISSEKSQPEDDFLVISGDALCDFDLTAALEKHKKVRAGATIITKKVNDPREYGLVLSDSENNGRITGFSEKPSYVSCIGDCANTGVYILSPKVMELVPNNTRCDFARDVFPKMLENELKDKLPLYSHEESGYWCDIGDFDTYAKSQFDILNGKVKCEIAGTKIADGIYSQSDIPSHVKITSPCYIGANVSFTTSENTPKTPNQSDREITVINSCIIGDHVNIGKNVKLKGSVILDSVFISNGATANHAIICQSAKLQHSASVYEDSVIGEECVIGREAVVSNGAKVWNRKSVPPGATIAKDVKYGSGKSRNAELSDTGLTGETNTDITPEFCARLGAALAVTSSEYSGKRIAVSCENNSASKAMKHAIIAGVSGAGGEVFDTGTANRAQLIYASKILDCGMIAHVKCGVFAQVEVLANSGLPLSRIEERRLEAALNRSEYKNADWNGFGEMHYVAGINDLHYSMLRKHANFKSDYHVKLNCNNAVLTKTLEPIFELISTTQNASTVITSSRNQSEILIVALTESGSKAEFYTENDTKIEYDKLLLLAGALYMSKGFDIALPHDFASCADFLATSYGKKVHRYFHCPNDNSDRTARALAANQPFLYDGAVLAMNVLEYLSQNKISIEVALKSIPHFASVRREIELPPNTAPQRIISCLCEQGSGKGEGVLLGNNRENVLVRSAKRGNALLLFAESLSSETASELCNNAENLVKELLLHNKSLVKSVEA